MDHDQTATTLTLERYMLGELPEPERDQFEEHFFNCAACAEEVRYFSQFTAGARSILADPAETDEKPGWLDTLTRWWSHPAYAGLCSAALAVMITVAGYQVAAPRKQILPQSVASFVLHPDARGEETVIGAPKLGDFLLLELDLPPASGRLTWEVRGVQSSSPLMAGIAAAPQAGDSLKLLLPASKLKPMQYALKIRPEQATPAAFPMEAAYRFRID